MRHDPVPGQSESVHAMGQPMSHSTNRGFKVRPGCKDRFPSFSIVGSGGPVAKRICSESCPRRWPTADDPFQSLAEGVFQFPGCTREGRGKSPRRPLWFGPPCDPSVALGVGQYEQSVALVGSTGVGRSDTTPLRIEPQRGKVSEDNVEAPASEGGHVFDEHPLGLGFPDDASELDPEAGPLATDTDP